MHGRRLQGHRGWQRALTALFGMWTFTPAYLGEDGESILGDDDDNNAATRVDDLPEPSVAVDDKDYLQFGWWTKVDDKGELEFRTFFGGADVFTITNIEGLVGTATYKGPAAGRYAVKTFNSNATIDSIRHGVFMAAATLTANFDGTSIAEDHQFSISGTINRFAGENGDDLGAWSVGLKATKFTASDTFPLAGAMDGDVEGGLGGAPVNSGAWKGCILRQSC